MSFDRNFWLFGNNPDSRLWKDESDFNNIVDKNWWRDYKTEEDFYPYYVTTNLEKIKPGDIAVFWSVRYFAITTLGLVTEIPYWNEDEEMNFINVAISQIPIDKWINGNKIKNEKAWKNKKPFAQRADGSFDQRFATPKQLDDFQIHSIRKKLSNKSKKFLTDNNLNRILSEYFRHYS